MATLIRFSPELGPWLLQHLDQGQPPAAVVQAMADQGMAPEAAQAIVDAFVAARRAGRPVPRDSIELADAAPAYAYDAGPPIFRPGRSIVLPDRTVRVLARAERPLLAVLGQVVSPAECEELIALARPRLKPSTVVDPQTGHDVVTGLRSSFGMFFRPQENAFIARLDRRFAEIMNLPVAHGEGLQILHYPVGAHSTPHFDFLVPSNPANQASLARSGQRVSTLVTYLNEVEEGGETVFPEAGWAVSPQRGNAVYFEYGNRLGQLDHASLHASRPVLRGEKWVATKWVRQRPFVAAGQEADSAAPRAPAPAVARGQAVPRAADLAIRYP
jgi:prolyl 4-hydroxylase